MCDVIAISNRKLVSGDYYEQIKKVVGIAPKAIILREKDLTDADYGELAERVKTICEGADTLLFIHSRAGLARSLGIRAIHVPISQVAELDNSDGFFEHISVACHSIEDAQTAIDYGATQIILGTIFETDCKKGLKGRGLGFVTEVCKYCDRYADYVRGKKPQIYAIGGITPDNLASVKAAGADGGCMMSFMMKL